MRKTFSFSTGTTDFYFGDHFSRLERLTDRVKTVLITDQHIYDAHARKFKGWRVIVLKPGERYKTQRTADGVIRQLIGMEVDRTFTLVGIGGGVVTDLTGYIASVYMRGIRFGFMPVSILAMVDAAIGGKNGVDVGPYKNLVGVIRQPAFLLYDLAFLKSLPHEEWVNGFAEIIKHASIRDARMFSELERFTVHYYKKNASALENLIRRNALIKANIVQHDEFEKADRKLLNFGHTWGHAIETKLRIPHGHAISIGMAVAGTVSEKINGFEYTPRLTALLQRYGLPIEARVNKKMVFRILKMDKKKDSQSMNYIVLEKIGKAVIHRLPISDLEQMIES